MDSQDETQSPQPTEGCAEDEAIAEYEQLSAYPRRGASHEDLRTAVIHDRFVRARELAEQRAKMGGPAEAATAYEQLLAECLRLLGPDNANTLATRAAIADYRGRAGEPAEAATAFEQLLADYLRLHGPNDFTTVAARAAAGYWQAQSRAERERS